MKDKYGTEVLGVTFAQDGIAVNITRTDTHLIEEDDKLIFVCDEMEFKDLLGVEDEYRLEQEETYQLQAVMDHIVVLVAEDNRYVRLYKEDMELLLKENCWNIQGV